VYPCTKVYTFRHRYVTDDVSYKHPVGEYSLTLKGAPVFIVFFLFAIEMASGLLMIRRSELALLGILCGSLAVPAVVHWLVLGSHPWPHQTPFETKADSAAVIGLILGVMCLGMALIVSAFDKNSAR
jgi:hypothetical protein